MDDKEKCEKLAPLKNNKKSGCNRLWSSNKNSCIYKIAIFENNIKVNEYKIKLITTLGNISTRYYSGSVVSEILMNLSFISTTPVNQEREIRVVFSSLDKNNGDGDIHLFNKDGKNKIPIEKWANLDDKEPYNRIDLNDKDRFYKILNNDMWYASGSVSLENLKEKRFIKVVNNTPYEKKLVPLNIPSNLEISKISPMDSYFKLVKFTAQNQEDFYNYVVNTITGKIYYKKVNRKTKTISRSDNLNGGIHSNIEEYIIKIFDEKEEINTEISDKYKNICDDDKIVILLKKKVKDKNRYGSIKLFKLSSDKLIVAFDDVKSQDVILNIKFSKSTVIHSLNYIFEGNYQLVTFEAVEKKWRVMYYWDINTNLFYYVAFNIKSGATLFSDSLDTSDPLKEKTPIVSFIKNLYSRNKYKKPPQAKYYHGDENAKSYTNLMAEIGSENVNVSENIDVACIEILKQGDFNSDGYKDVLVNHNHCCGGNACETFSDVMFFYVGKNQFISSNNEIYYKGDWKGLSVKKWRGLWTYLIRTTKENGTMYPYETMTRFALIDGLTIPVEFSNKNIY